MKKLNKIFVSLFLIVSASVCFACGKDKGSIAPTDISSLGVNVGANNEITIIAGEYASNEPLPLNVEPASASFSDLNITLSNGNVLDIVDGKIILKRNGKRFNTGSVIVTVSAKSGEAEPISFTVSVHDPIAINEYDEFNTLAEIKDAITNNISDSGVSLKLLHDLDFDTTNDDLFAVGGKKCQIDLNGHNITLADEATLEFDGDITLYNKNINNDSLISSTNATTILNKDNLTINDLESAGNIEIKSNIVKGTKEYYDSSLYTIKNEGLINIVKNVFVKGFSGIYCGGNATNVELGDIEIESVGHALYSIGNGNECSIDGTTISSDYDAIIVAGLSKVNSANATIESKRNGVQVIGNSLYNMTSGKIETEKVAILGDSVTKMNINLTGGEITSKSSVGVLVNSQGNIVIDAENNNDLVITGKTGLLAFLGNISVDNATFKGLGSGIDSINDIIFEGQGFEILTNAVSFADSNALTFNSTDGFSCQTWNTTMNDYQETNVYVKSKLNAVGSDVEEDQNITLNSNKIKYEYSPIVFEGMEDNAITYNWEINLGNSSFEIEPVLPNLYYKDKFSYNIRSCDFDLFDINVKSQTGNMDTIVEQPEDTIRPQYDQALQFNYNASNPLTTSGTITVQVSYIYYVGEQSSLNNTVMITINWRVI